MKNLLILLSLPALLALSGCDTSPPYSNVIDRTGGGVGFSDYAQYMRAQEELSRIRRQEATQAQASGRATGPRFAHADTAQQGAHGGGQDVGRDAVAAVRGSAQLPAQPQAQPQQVASASPAPSSAGVSDQGFTPQPFGTPTQNRVVTRDHVPQVRVNPDELGSGQEGPNLFVYALSTRHNVGDERYTRRHPLRWQRWEAACAQFATQDLAQEAFLAAGGPERDPNHLDPDGDGFACWWDPTPFRQAVHNVRARQ
ncbi:MAG: hypothetical protein JJT99_09610 [Rhodobacteraceae bacterium]|nr:hypothetical protein [Paracoccaceae bacterium]